MNRVALVTGASRGIGKEVAGYFASKGYDLVLLARNGEKLHEVAEALRSAHRTNVSWSSVDVCAFDEVRSIVEQHISNCGRLDVLVNAAGIFRFGTSVLSNEDLDAMLSTNVKAVHNLCTVCNSALKLSDRGHIFNVSSVAGIEGFAPVGGYSASKFALVGYSQSLAKELLSANVKVTTLCPDVVDTDMAAASGLPAEQMISPKDICKAIDFVMSLSPSAIVDQMVIKCKVVLEAANIRK